MRRKVGSLEAVVSEVYGRLCIIGSVTGVTRGPWRKLEVFHAGTFWHSLLSECTVGARCRNLELVGYFMADFDPLE